MPNYVISPPQITGLPIDGTDALFPVRRVYCIGRNYAEHAKEAICGIPDLNRKLQIRFGTVARQVTAALVAQKLRLTAKVWRRHPFGHP